MKRLIVVCCSALGAAIPFACGSSVSADGIAPVSVAPAEAEYTSNAATLGQAGNSSVYHFDITAGTGRLTVNLAEQTLVFSGKGYQPNRTYSLQYTVGDDPGVHVLASGVATPTGRLEIDGTWTGDATTLGAAAFSVSMASAGTIISWPTVWRVGNDSCLGPYAYAGSWVVMLMSPITVGTTVGLTPDGTFSLMCNRWVQGVWLATDYVAYETYFFPAQPLCPLSATCP